MNNNLIDNLCYPKPNIDDLYAIYEFEVNLIKAILNGETDNALKLYEEFFSKEYFYNLIGGEQISCMKSYLISLSLLICHSIVKKGVSPYSARAKYQAFSKILEDSMCKIEILDIGKKLVRAYTTQVIKNLNKIDNVSIRKAIDYIHNNLGEELTLDMVADHANLSKCYFCTQFKKETKVSFTDYLNYIRIEKSKYLLCNSNKSILDIAILMGFNSQSYFTTQFKKYTGVTPREFREKKDNEDYML